MSQMWRELQRQGARTDQEDVREREGVAIGRVLVTWDIINMTISATHFLAI